MKLFTAFLTLIQFPLLLAPLKTYAQTNAAFNRPNVIIILADDMGYGDVSCLNRYAKTSTPNIDNFARQAVTFSNAHAAGSVCIPSRYGLMTGRHYFRLPKHSEYLGYLKPLIEQERETLGSLLKHAGYVTGFIGKWHLGVNWQVKIPNKPQIAPGSKTYTNTDFSQPINQGPGDAGFDYSFILPASLDMPPYVFVKNNKVIDTSIVLTTDKYPKSLSTTEPVWDKRYTDSNDVYWERGIWWRNGEMSSSFRMEDCLDSITQESLSFITRQANLKSNEPFFLYMALTGPHTPWVPNLRFKHSSPMGPYGDFVKQVDNVVGQITNQLAKLKIDGNTIVIFTSDNGAPWSEEDIQYYEHRANYPWRGQKGDIYDGGHHIPLFIKWPAMIKQRITSNAPVSLMDMMRTLADMTNTQLAEGAGEDSFSFYKILSQQKNVTERLYLMYESSRGMLAIQKDGWKYIDGLGSGGFTEPYGVKSPPNRHKGQLYNLQTDPGETNDLYSLYPTKAKELSSILQQAKGSKGLREVKK